MKAGNEKVVTSAVDMEIGTGMKGIQQLPRHVLDWAAVVTVYA